MSVSRINCNLKSQTIEEIAGRRRREVVGMRPYIKQDCLRDWETIKSSLAENVAQFPGDTFPEWEHHFDVQKVQEELLLEHLFDTLACESQRPAHWFNDDSKYSVALRDAVDYRQLSIARLVMSVIRDKRFKADSLESKICRPQPKAPGNAEALLGGKRHEGMEGTHMEVGRVMEEDEQEPMILDDPSDNLNSNHPLYETKGAGLTLVVEGMLEMGVGFRTTDIAEAGKRVEEACR